MEANLAISFRKFDAQTNDRLAAYIELNNLYLDIERGYKFLTIHTANRLRVLAGRAYAQGDSMLDWWASEFQKLAGWESV